MQTPEPLLSTADPKAVKPPTEAEASIETLISKANEEQSEARGFMEPKSEKKKRGRPKKEPQSEQTPPETGEPGPSTGPTGAEYAAALRGLFTVGSNMLVRATKVPDVALQPQEIDSLSITWSSVIHRYMPAYLATHQELLAAFAVTGMVGFRIHMVLTEEIEKRKAEKAKKVEPENVRDAFDH